MHYRIKGYHLSLLDVKVDTLEVQIDGVENLKRIICNTPKLIGGSISVLVPNSHWAVIDYEELPEHSLSFSDTIPCTEKVGPFTTKEDALVAGKKRQSELYAPQNSDFSITIKKELNKWVSTFYAKHIPEVAELEEFISKHKTMQETKI